MIFNILSALWILHIALYIVFSKRDIDSSGQLLLCIRVVQCAMVIVYGYNLATNANFANTAATALAVIGICLAGYVLPNMRKQGTDTKKRKIATITMWGLVVLSAVVQIVHLVVFNILDMGQYMI